MLQTPEKPSDAPRRNLNPSRTATASRQAFDTTLKPPNSPQYSVSRTPHPPTQDKRPSLRLTRSVRDLLPRLAAQPPFYAIIHIHAKPYLVTAGDTIRLPFLMHGVLPGDVLRLNRASRLGSRDYTLLGGPAFPRDPSETETAQPTTVEPIIGKTEGLPHTPYRGSSTTEVGKNAGLKKKGPPAYLDERLFLCRAVVMGTEAEPMRVKEKTKRRQRHIKHLKSKHKYTILRVKQVDVKGLEELEAEETVQTQVRSEVSG